MKTLLLALLLGQTIYEWVDSKGESHFTDDQSSIPKGAKVRTTSGAPVMVMPMPQNEAPRSSDGGLIGVPSTSRELPSCSKAKDEITAIEARIAKLKSDYAQLQSTRSARCRATIQGQTQVGYAQCMQAGDPPPDLITPGLELDEARERLRKLQVSGCQ
ncbi:MAG: DUF4124 domain-containing protein [Myxococcaceae bacterium]